MKNIRDSIWMPYGQKLKAVAVLAAMTVCVHLAQCQTFTIAEGMEDEFAKIIDTENALLKTNATVQTWLEGPVWVPSDGGYLLFSAMRSVNKVMKLVPPSDLSDFFAPEENLQYNGHILDFQERLISAQAGSEGLKVVRTSLDDMNQTVLASRYDYEGEGEDLKFYSPNDIAVKSDGTIWFTDPGYDSGVADPPVNGFGSTWAVYRFHPDDGDGSSVRVTSRLVRPNGICFSPDESILYVADHTARQIRFFEVLPDNTLLFLRFPSITLPNGGGNPDGIKCDADGRIWSSGAGAVHIFTPEGDLIGTINVGGGSVGNLCFGGPDYKTLYITRQPNVLSIPLRVAGAPAVRKIEHSVTDGSVNLSWPAPSTGFKLQESEDVAASESWVESERAPEVVDGKNNVEINPSMDDDARYFRLKLN